MLGALTPFNVGAPRVSAVAGRREKGWNYLQPLHLDNGAVAASGEELVTGAKIDCQSPIKAHYAIVMREIRAPALSWARCPVTKSAGEGGKQQVRHITAVGGFDPQYTTHGSFSGHRERVLSCFVKVWSCLFGRFDPSPSNVHNLAMTLSWTEFDGKIMIYIKFKKKS